MSPGYQHQDGEHFVRVYIKDKVMNGRNIVLTIKSTNVSQLIVEIKQFIQ